MKQEDRIKKINMVVLATVLVSTFSGFIPFYKLTDSTTVLIVISQVLLILPSVVYMIIEKQSFAKTVRIKPIRVSTFFKLLVFTWCITPVINLVNALSQLFAVNTISGVMETATKEVPIAVGLVVIALLPCIFEESVYRGICYNEYRKVNPLKGMLLSALLFGLVHGNINQCVYAIVYGMIFVLIIEATDSILSSMIMHFIINANSVMILYLLPKLMGYMEHLYNTMIQAGENESAQMIKDMLGVETFSMDELFASSSEYMAQATVADVFSAYGMQAIIFGFLAFLLYRNIARGEGRYEHIQRIFSKNYSEEETQADSTDYGISEDEITALEGVNNGIIQDGENRSIYGNSKKKLVTWPLAAAIGILAVMMVLTELESRGMLN